LKTLVVFRRDRAFDGGHPLARFLDLQHVFCVLETGNAWIRVDGMDGCPVVTPVAPADYDLATFYRSMGYVVLEGRARTDVPAPPLVLGNCVGLVKAFIGERCRAVTPTQLFNNLKGTRRWM
jgi:hypothetical protein